MGLAAKAPTTTRSLRVELATRSKAIRLYSASDVSLWPSDSIENHPFLTRIGPDVLDPSLTVEAVQTRLQGSRFSGRSLSALLLDQSFLAGMGNYLRSEVLFEAGIAPQYRPRDLSSIQVSALAAALKAVPRRSYQSRGIRRSRGMKADYIESGSEAFRFQVFGRADQPCLRCGQLIRRIESAGRRLYLCHHCQA